ncbi:DUF2975 domain-containing protein [Nocardioides sp. 616]|uniref:DUF2975 domain-containing protein n=1 Tax=Nocardioides sp. 616 TaxID=2268090 RepID=UPI000CE450A9|nr:DUF2975 domain-containing protein [Nocardioides sp. 616]
MRRKVRDPLAPIEMGVYFVWGVLMLSLLLIPLAIWGTGSIGGVGRGDPEVCVEAAPGVVIGYGNGTYFDEHGEVSGGSWEGPVGVKSGVSDFPVKIRYCDSRPDSTAQVLEGVRGLFPLVAALGFFEGFRRVLRRARTAGVFSTTVARGLSVLGWYMIAWGSLETLTAGLVDAALLRSMAEGRETQWFVLSGSPWVPLLVGLGLLSAGRIMVHAVVLREDVEATI